MSLRTDKNDTTPPNVGKTELCQSHFLLSLWWPSSSQLPFNFLRTAVSSLAFDIESLGDFTASARPLEVPKLLTDTVVPHGDACVAPQMFHMSGPCAPGTRSSLPRRSPVLCRPVTTAFPVRPDLVLDVISLFFCFGDLVSASFRSQHGSLNFHLNSWMSMTAFSRLSRESCGTPRMHSWLSWTSLNSSMAARPSA